MDICEDRVAFSTEKVLLFTLHNTVTFLVTLFNFAFADWTRWKA